MRKLHLFAHWRHETCGKFRDGKCAYCDYEPPQKVMNMFKSRRDRQITSLEILSIALGKECDKHRSMCELHLRSGQEFHLSPRRFVAEMS